MRARVLALLTGVTAASACSLGLHESDIHDPAAGGDGGASDAASGSSRHTSASGPGSGSSMQGSMATGSSPQGSGGAGASGSTGPGTQAGPGPVTTGPGTGPGTGGAGGCGNGSCSGGETCTSCPSDCGCGSTEYCAGAACAACLPTFRVDVPGSLAGADIVARSNRKLFTPTLDASDGHVAVGEIDSCSGTYDALVVSPPSNAPASNAHVAALGSGAVVSVEYAAGVDPGAALVAGVDPGPVLAFSKTKNPSNLADSLRGVASAAGLWMTHGTQGLHPQNWILYGDTNHLCQLTGALGDSFGRAITADGNNVYAGAITGASTIRLAFFDMSTCTASPCICAPTSTPAGFNVAADSNVLGGMFAIGGTIYLGGYGSDDGTTHYAFVAAVDASSGTLGAVYKGSAVGGGNISSFTTLASDGQSLFAGGYENSNGSDLDTAQGVLLAFPLGSLAAPSYAIRPAYAHAFSGVAADADGIYAQIDRSPGATIVKCAKQSDGCPQ